MTLRATTGALISGVLLMATSAQAQTANAQTVEPADFLTSDADPVMPFCAKAIPSPEDLAARRKTA